MATTITDKLKVDSPVYKLQLARGNPTQHAYYAKSALQGELTINMTNDGNWTLNIHKGGGKYCTIESNVEKVAVADGAVNDSQGNEIHTTYAKLAGEGTNHEVIFDSKDDKKPVKVIANMSVASDENTNVVATTAWVNTAASVVHKTGSETITGDKKFTGATEFTQVIKGEAMSARWADLAENYISDFEYPYGTLICFGGEQEVTIATEKVNGVVSRQPALIMNRECTEGLPIALAGRVDVLVKGKVTKFDNIVLSDVAGVGVVDNEAPVDLVIGKALRDKDTVETDTVLCATKFNLM